MDPWKGEETKERGARSPVVLLGASGFLGKAVRADLERAGYVVWGGGSATIDLRRPESLDTLRRVVSSNTILIMAAAVMRDRGNAIQAFEDHMAMIARVARLLSDGPIRKCLYVSSAAVYGDGTTNEAITEEAPVNPDTQYAMAKLAGELLMTQAAVAVSTPAVILRACRIYGPGDPNLVSYGPAQFIKTAHERGVIELFGEGEERREYVFIDDAARAVRRLAGDASTGVYNLANGRPASFATVAGAIQRLLPGPVAVRHRPRYRPVTHQAFVPAKLMAACPDLVWTPLEDGLTVAVAASPAEARVG